MKKIKPKQTLTATPNCA